MPSGRRNFGRSGTGRLSHSLFDEGAKSRFNRNKSSTNSTAVQPRHIPFPTLEDQSNILFEIMIFVYSCMASSLQFLNLYRSYWWAHKNYTEYLVNFYMINPYLVAFIGMIFARRLFFKIICTILLNYTAVSEWPMNQLFVRKLTLIVILVYLSWCTYNILTNHSMWSVIFLFYPILVYFAIFKLNISPFFDLFYIEDDNYGEGFYEPSHICSNSPQTIREEVNYLKNDFNNRLKQISFSCLLDAYYAGFIPYYFAQGYVYYHNYWILSVSFFIFYGSLTMYATQFFPLKYYHTLHESAIHLGSWDEIKSKTTHFPYSTWLESSLWTEGSVVKIAPKKYYRAVGISNAADPSSNMQRKFYNAFSNPTLMYTVLLTSQMMIIGIQLLFLMFEPEWYKVISLALLMMANYYPLTKFMRDFIVSKQVYRAEEILFDRYGPAG